jgi:hypothetical protein
MFFCGMPRFDRKLFWAPGSELQNLDRISERSELLLRMVVNRHEKGTPSKRGSDLKAIDTNSHAMQQSLWLARPSVREEFAPPPILIWDKARCQSRVQGT